MDKAQAQNTGNFSAPKYTGAYSQPTIEGVVSRFSLYKIDSKTLQAFVSAEPVCYLNLDFGGERYTSVTLEAHDIRSADYKLLVSSPNGLVELPRPANISYQGLGSDGGKAVLTITDHYIGGILTFNGVEHYIEPARHFDPTVEDDTYIVYKSADVVPSKENGCLALQVDGEIDRQVAKPEPENTERTPPSGCVVVRYAIASDASMYAKYGSISAVTTQTAAVTALVNTDYNSVFNRLISYSIVANIVSTDASVCPESGWSTSTDPTVLLPAFRDWGNGLNCGGGSFGVTFDLTGLWTNRDFDGSTVGLAYVPGICGTSKYHVLQDFTTDMPSLRCMTTHEIGHNWSCIHDGSAGFIMSPSVSSTTTWSATSIASVNARDIASACVTGTYALLGSPIARFTIPSQWCSSYSFNLTDQSYRSPTIWSWSMPGSSPSSASTQNSTAFYSTSGSKSIDLTVSNANCSGATNMTTRSVTIISDIYPSGHCTTSSTNTGTAGSFNMGIYNVALAGMTNPTSSSNGDGTAFIDSTCTKIATLTSNSNSITITVGTLNMEKARAWIDFDNNGTFLDPGERIVNFATGFTGAQTGSFNIPYTVSGGGATVTGTLLKMRVMDDFAGSATPSPCITPTYGQSENYGVIIQASALPIELTEFEAKKSGDGVALRWETATETNNSHFLVERSLDGVRFERVATVKGAGNSLAPLDYSAFDPTPWPGENFYRLGQVDFDGQTRYSEIRQVVFDRTEQDLQAVVSPNPLQGNRIALRLFCSVESEVAADLFDMTGRLVISEKLQTGSGWNDFQIVPGELPSGQFVLQLKSPATTRVVKIQN